MVYIPKEFIRECIQECNESLLRWLNEAPETDLHLIHYVGEETLDKIYFRSEQQEHATELLTWARGLSDFDGRRHLDIQSIRRSLIATRLGKLQIIVEHTPLTLVSAMEDMTEEEVRYHVDLARQQGMNETCLEQLEKFLRECLAEREKELAA